MAIDFGLMGVGEIGGLIAGLEGFNLADMASSLALTGTAHEIAPPGSELASATATGSMQAQVAEMDAICQASGANIMAYVTVSEGNKVGGVLTDVATSAPFSVL